jgi:hypothetical protein
MDPQLPPGWQIFRNPNGQVIYANVSTGQFQDTPPVAAAALALPPGWTQMTNDSGRTVYINQSLSRMQFEFPQAEAVQAQAPSAPPVDPRTERVKTQYYPHVHPFSKIPPADIIEMLYHPYPSPDLTPDDIDLIINNYVGTAINSRGMICRDDVDILSCAKKLFLNNAYNAKYKYSFQLPIQSANHQCDVSFRWNPDNESKKPLGDNPTACLSCRLFPLNDNTVRWLCSTHTNPIPTMNEALESKFVLDFFDAQAFRMSPAKTPLEIAAENRERMSTPQYREQQAELAVKAQEQQRIQDEAERQRILDLKRREEQARIDAAKKAAFEDHMRKIHGGLKRKQSRRKRMQSKRKQVKRKQSRRRS